MAKPFDNATKQLVEAYPDDWIRWAGLPGGPAELIAADLSTVVADADRVLRVGGPSPYLAHFEFQATYDADMAERMLHYNVLLRYRHRIPVQSTLVLLRPKADGPRMMSAFEYQTQNCYVRFGYETVRVWQLTPGDVLQGGLGTLPLAPLTSVIQDDVPAVVSAMEKRILEEANNAEAGILWLNTYLLMGLTYTQAFAADVLKGVRGMEESVTYQAIIERGEARGEARGEMWGRAAEARRLIEQIGSRRFGMPSTDVLAQLTAVTSADDLERLAGKLLDVENWNELLA